jgi:hypothetical protein
VRFGARSAVALFLQFAVVNTMLFKAKAVNEDSERDRDAVNGGGGKRRREEEEGGGFIYNQQVTEI